MNCINRSETSTDSIAASWARYSLSNLLNSASYLESFPRIPHYHNNVLSGLGRSSNILGERGYGVRYCMTILTQNDQIQLSSRVLPRRRLWREKRDLQTCSWPRLRICYFMKTTSTRIWGVRGFSYSSSKLLFFTPPPSSFTPFRRPRREWFQNKADKQSAKGKGRGVFGTGIPMWHIMIWHVIYFLLCM